MGFAWHSRGRLWIGRSGRAAHMGKGIFITGTGTDVGKTYVTALLVKALQEAGAKAAYYKAAASGNQRDGQGRLVPGDAVWVKEVSGIAQPLETMIPYVYEDAVSPHLAARKEGNPVEPFVVLQGYHRLRREYGYVTMEGSGGILCPLRWENGKGLWLEDVAKELQLPCLVVADAGLGTINSTVLTLEYLNQKGIAAKGVILNRFHPGNEMELDNLRMIERRGAVPVVACVQEHAEKIELAPERLMSLYE